MHRLSTGWQAVVNSEPSGLAVSVAGMTIVFLALVLISLFIATLPRVLDLLSSVFPDEEAKADTDHDRIAVAIAAALYREKFGASK
ncbi:MAG: OadG family protein [Lentisphaerae bacterium]|nr:OadG family protein [Lentisphaerota bacterium]